LARGFGIHAPWSWRQRILESFLKDKEAVTDVAIILKNFELNRIQEPADI
jgi:hypothetical protein